MSTLEADDRPTTDSNSWFVPRSRQMVQAARSGLVGSGISRLWPWSDDLRVTAREDRPRARTHPLAVDRRAVGAGSAVELGAGGLVLLDTFDPGPLSAVGLDQPGRLCVFTGLPRGHRASPGTQLDGVRGCLEWAASLPHLSDGSTTPVARCPGRRCRAVRRQHLALPCRGHRAWLPLAGHLGTRHPHEGHARHRPAVVRPSA